MHGHDLLAFALVLVVGLFLLLVLDVWVERQRRIQRQRSADLRRRLSWYIHGRGL